MAEAKRTASQVQSIQERIRRGRGVTVTKAAARTNSPAATPTATPSANPVAKSRAENSFSMRLVLDNTDALVEQFASRVAETLIGGLKHLVHDAKVSRVMEGSRSVRVQHERPAASTARAKAPSGDELYVLGFYRNPCKKCHKGIKRTGKTGKPPQTHKTCP